MMVLSIVLLFLGLMIVACIVGNHMDTADSNRESYLSDLYYPSQPSWSFTAIPTAPEPEEEAIIREMEKRFALAIVDAQKEFALTVSAMQEQIDELWEEVREL